MRIFSENLDSLFKNILKEIFELGTSRSFSFKGVV